MQETAKNSCSKNLTKVNVTVEGNPNDIYSNGLAKRDMYREAVRFFGSSTCEKYLGLKCVSRRKFYTDKFACVIDFRTVDNENVSCCLLDLILVTPTPILIYCRGCISRPSTVTPQRYIITSRRC